MTLKWAVSETHSSAVRLFSEPKCKTTSGTEFHGPSFLDLINTPPISPQPYSISFHALFFVASISDLALMEGHSASTVLVYYLWSLLSNAGVR